MMQKQLEQMGFPSPQPPKIYSQRYTEGLLRILITLLLAVGFRVLGQGFGAAAQIWICAYLGTVGLVYALKLPKEFSVGNEIQLCFQHFLAFFVVYMLVDNGIMTFSQ